MTPLNYPSIRHVTKSRSILFKVGVQLQRDQCQNFSLGHNFMDTPLIEAKLLKNAASKFSVNLAMSPQKVTFLKKPPFSNLSSYCSDSVSVTIKIIKQKTESDKPVGLTRLWGSVYGSISTNFPWRNHHHPRSLAAIIFGDGLFFLK